MTFFLIRKKHIFYIWRTRLRKESFESPLLKRMQNILILLMIELYFL